MTLRPRKLLRDLATRHVGGTALVLIYHRVTTLDRDPQLLAVSPHRFDAQLALLAETYPVLPLEDLIHSLHRRHVPDRSIAVTFDDGYADNLFEAAPLLQKHHLPATVFVSSGHVESGREYWWDEVDALVFDAETLPEEISVEAAGEVFSAVIDDASLDAEASAEDAGWSAEEPAHTARQRLYLELCAFLRPLDSGSRESALAQLRSALAADPSPRPTHRPLTPDEVSRLAQVPGIDIGGHTISHQVLGARTIDEQRAEVTNDRLALERLTGREPEVFSYPYGSLSDYDRDTVRIVREAGYVGACSNHPGVVKPWTDPYRIPRCIVRDWDADELHRRIEGWLHG